MKLSRIVITNFRCFETLTVGLEPDVNVFVGANGTGKTAILDAIGIGLSAILRRLSSASQRLRSATINDTDFRVVADGELRTGGPRYALAAEAQIMLETTEGVRWGCRRPSGRRRTEPRPKARLVGLDKYLASYLSEAPTSAAPKPFPVFAYYSPYRALLSIPERLHPSKTDFTQPASALVGCLDAKANFKECLQWFDAAEADELRANRDRTNGGFEESIELHAVRHAIRTVFGESVANPRFEGRSHKLVVDYRLPDSRAVPLRVDQLSQGYQAMLAMVMDFARRQALANPAYRSPDAGGTLPTGLREPEPWMAPGMMLVDEIDLHLHPTWQQRVIPDLRRTFPNTQLIVTTHSPQVLTTVHRENIRILRDLQIYAATANTYGTESARAMQLVMQVPGRPPGNENTEAVLKLFALINEGQLDEAAVACQRLMKTMGTDEPALIEAQTIIENRRWEKELGL